MNEHPAAKRLRDVTVVGVGSEGPAGGQMQRHSLMHRRKTVREMAVNWDIHDSTEILCIPLLILRGHGMDHVIQNPTLACS